MVQNSELHEKILREVHGPSHPSFFRAVHTYDSPGRFPLFLVYLSCDSDENRKHTHTKIPTRPFGI